jgi:GNAT superfamily N-acetyltransferase
MERYAGVRLTDADLSRHHEAFRGELPQLLGPRGRLIVARFDRKPVGVGALRPVDAATCEIKRMYVQPAAQGLGVGRAILSHLIQDARYLRYATVRLETLQFMITARSMYRAFGFIVIPGFDHSEASSNRLLDPITIFMELNLDVVWRPDDC